MALSVAFNDATTAAGVLAPAGTPPEIIARLNQAINGAASDKQVADRLKHEGAQAISGSPEDFANALSAELEMWQGVVRKSGMALD